MSYTTALDLLTGYGAKELAEIAAPDDLIPVSPELMRRTLSATARDGYSPGEIEAADAAAVRIAAALDEAARLLDSYLARRFSLPLADTVIAAGPLPRVCRDVARRFLYDDQVPEVVTSRHDQALQWLRELASGLVELPGQGEVAGTATGGPAFSASPRVFDATTLQGF